MFTRVAMCRRSLLCLLCVILVCAVGCSGGSSPAAPSTAATAPQIAGQPGAQAVYVGDTATFTVNATGTAPLSYQWSRGGTAISGATTSTYITPALTLSDDGAQFSVTVANAAGSVSSQSAKLSVAVKAPSIATQPASTSVVAGTAVIFSVTAAGSPPLVYQWSRSGSPIAGATASTYTLPMAALSDSGSIFSVTVGNAAGSVNSNTATLTVTAAPPALTAQPANLTVFPKEAATFAVSASGSSPTYQWRRNGAAIVGATQATYTLASPAAADDQATFDVIVANAAGTVTSSVATLRVAPFATTYKTQVGATLNLYAWPGTKTAVLTGTAAEDPAAMRKFVQASDNTYNYYARSVGKEPWLYFNYNGLATIAEIPANQVTCGAGCTYIGATGMEMWDPYFNAILYTIPNGSYDQIMFYEYGRSFWLFPQLSFASGDDNSCLVTGFAVLMRYRSLNALGLQGNSNSFATSAADTRNVANGVVAYNTMVANMLGLIDTYTANPSLNWNNTFLKNSYAGTGGLGCTDLFTSLVNRIAKNFGDEAFIQALWKQVLLRPTPKTTQDAIDNFVLAASAAANHNLTDLFITTYKWPVSTSAVNEAVSKYGRS